MSIWEGVLIIAALLLIAVIASCMDEAPPSDHCLTCKRRWFER